MPAPRPDRRFTLRAYLVGVRLLGSRLALLALVALEAAGDLSLTETARAIGARASSAQRALEVLVDDGIAMRVEGKPRPHYRLASTPTARSVLDLARAQLPAATILAVAARASRVVEFLGRAPHLVVVFAPSSRVAEQARVSRIIDGIGAQSGTRIEYMEHDDVRRELLAHPELRDRMVAGSVLHGSLDRSFPDRSAHGSQPGEPLGMPNAALALPSRRALRALALQHGVASLRLIGSAVRTDFRPGSDVDVVVGLRPGTRPTVSLMAALESDLERLFDRDVDLVREEALRPELRDRVADESVALL